MKLSTNLFLFFLIILFAPKADASHIFGGELNYKHLNGLTYEITLTLYGDCSGQSFPNLPASVPVIAVYNGLNAFSSLTLTPYGIVGEEVTPVCPDEINNTACKGGLLPGVARFIFKGNITLNANSTDWLFVFRGELGGGNNFAGRSGAITNITQQGGYTIMQLEATLNNLNASNNSSTYTTIPTPFFCNNHAQQYNQGAVDIDGDQLSFSLVPALNANGGNVTYTAPYTYDDPLGYTPGTFNFSSTTGQLSFTPNSIQNSLVVSKVTETRNGVVVGTSMREMVFVVLNCSNQSPGGAISNNNVGTINNGSEITICNANSNLQFVINASDPDNQKIVVSYSGLPAGAVLNISNNNTSAPTLNFNWNIPLGIANGDYTFYVTFQDDGCPLSSKQTIAYTVHYTQPISTNITTIAESCVPSNDGSIGIVANSINGGFSYSLNANPFQNNAIYANLSSGIYTITVKDNQNCTYSTTALVSPPLYPAIEQIKVQDIRCNGGTDGSLEAIVAPASSSYSYQLLPNNIITTSNVFLNLLEDSYTIIVSDTNGCKDTATANIVEPDKLAFGDIEITPLSCDKINGKIKVKTNFEYNIRYKLIPTSLAIDTFGFFDNLASGFYTIVARNANDCVIDTTVFVDLIPKSFFISSTKKDLPCWGKGNEGEAEVILSGGQNPISILWSSTPPQTTAIANNLGYGYYFVEAIDATGCAVKDTVYIAPGNCCENIFFPSAFSPNNDGLNDEWHMVTSTGMEIEQFAVFDRWGQKVWFSRDQRYGWDGKINKGDAELGTYFYLLRYKCLSDQKHYSKTGDIILVR